MSTPSIAIYIEDLAKKEEAQHLSLLLQLPIVAIPTDQQYVLAFTTKRIELRSLHEKMKPIYVDFLHPEFVHRLQKSTHRNELIARAVGIKPPYYPSIIDATAGLGSDAILLSKLGCHIEMVERSAIICALLRDGLARGNQLRPDLIPNINVHCEDAKLFLTRTLQQDKQIDVIYLDPMFTMRTKSALVRKEMRILKEIVGGDDDAAEVFYIAQRLAPKRVVVKRPLHAPCLTTAKPAIVYKGKACRFDVYLCFIP